MDEHDFSFHGHDNDHDPHGHHQDHQHQHDHTSAQVGSAIDVANHDDAAEAMLASLRAVINDNDDDNNDNVSDGDLLSHQDQQQHGEGSQMEGTPLEGTPPTLNAFVPVRIGIPVASGSSLPTSLSGSSQTPDKLLASLNNVIKDNQTILDAMNSPGAIQGLAQSIKGLGEGNKKLAELAKGLTAQFRLAELIDADIDPALASPGVVLRSEYDLLKAKYDALQAAAPNAGGKRGGGPGRKPKTPKADPGISAVIQESRRDDSLVPVGGTEGRKKRSIKLEHLVHKMANRRLGVEYQVSNFECKGSRDLPDPSSQPPKAENSVNGVDEYRPSFVGDVDADTVKPFIGRVVEDVVEAWDAGLGADEPDVDRERIVGAVNIYWTRLVKRYDEQLHRERGEVHRDELSRRKQNTYRRQQSLLARRLAAFDTSPLNLCKLRALYRTLLTIDFAAPTQDQPDPKRAYTPDEWYAYRKAACESRANEAHEVIDQFWLSSNARGLLNILDVYSADQTARTRRKGRPKQPNPTFHLPAELWDRSTLPILRQKDSSGLPIPGAQGIILFRFHVDEQVQLENPEWAAGLYDNPPIPDEDTGLPSLPEIMASPIYAELRPAIKTARQLANPKTLTAPEVEDINLRVNGPEDAIEADQAILDDPANAEGLDLAQSVGEDGEFMTFAALSNLATTGTASGSGTNGKDSNAQTGDIDTLVGHAAIIQGELDAEGSPDSVATPFKPSTADASVNVAASAILNNPFLIASLPSLSSSTSTETAGNSAGIGVGPSPGSSMRARKLGKRMVSEVPGGAATPVPTKRRKEGTGIGIGVALTSASTTVGDGMEVDGDLNDDAAFLEGL